MLVPVIKVSKWNEKCISFGVLSGIQKPMNVLPNSFEIFISGTTTHLYN